MFKFFVLFDQKQFCAFTLCFIALQFLNNLKNQLEVMKTVKV